MEDGKIYYLVKWCAQTYDLCTWESDETVEKVRGLSLILDSI